MVKTGQTVVLKTHMELNRKCYYNFLKISVLKQCGDEIRAE